MALGRSDDSDLGQFGVYTFDFEFQPAARIRESIRELEEQGWRAFWIPELLGREALTHAGYLLSCTQQMHICNGIAQIASREAQGTYGASLLMADAYPDRHVLGLGLGNARPGIKPMAAMNEYLDELDALETPNPTPKTPIRRILAAYGPKMLELARDRAARRPLLPRQCRTHCAGTGHPRTGRVPRRRARRPLRVRPRQGPRNRARAHGRLPDH